MVLDLRSTQSDIIYPDSDGQPMADNTKQFEYIVYIKKGLDWIFANHPDVFVGGDLLWYPVEGNNKLRQAPDVMVVFGRPKGDRGSYQQWREEGIPPQVVFEIISPGNTVPEMNRKHLFYERYGVEEYYLYDPDRLNLAGYLRVEDTLEEIDAMAQWISPRLRVRFELNDAGKLTLYRPDDQPFETYEEVATRAEQERQRAEQERQRAEQERQRAEQEHQRAEDAEARASLLEERLRAAGIDPADLK
ncbi:Uma2 family endonuclease [Myxacorys almedinensis]|uniref:Uma2 family endonuclease n=1 Tax=Myxacorys almedinensis A TaxID=2690445 RepID=A0A8J8CGP1_9CYAN|nr:Uma2 family endonuclease [Myxacorys almedinensis]NDJ15948.1 Uma2 family endonuclease [Myxacorys almedinensis A]